MAEYNARIRQKRDTSANWTAKDPILLDGEIIIVDTASGSVRKKVGDGMLLRPQTTFRCWLSMRFSAHAAMRTLPKRTIRRSMLITLLEIRR